MNDLVFGEGGWVTVLDGGRELSRLDGDNPNIDVYLKGDLPAPAVWDALQAEDFTDRFGRFVVLVHDRRKGSLTVWNDRYGQLALFVARGDRTLFLAARMGPSWSAA